MAPKTMPPADDPDTPSVPAELLELLRGGLTFNGVRVLTLRVELADGTTQRLQMPAPAPPPKDWTKTKAGRAILDVLAREGRPLKGATIAKLTGYGYAGSFRSALAGLVKQGELLHDEDDDGYELA